MKLPQSKDLQRQVRDFLSSSTKKQPSCFLGIKQKKTESLLLEVLFLKSLSAGSQIIWKMSLSYFPTSFFYSSSDIQIPTPEPL